MNHKTILKKRIIIIKISAKKIIFLVLILSVGQSTFAYDHPNSLHWLPISECIKFQIASLPYKAILNYCKPSYLAALLTSYQPLRIFHSSGTNLLSVPDIRSSIGRRSFKFAAPKLWNSLPQDLRSFKCIATFLGKLKLISSRRRSEWTLLPWITDLHCFWISLSLRSLHMQASSGGVKMPAVAQSARDVPDIAFG